MNSDACAGTELAFRIGNRSLINSDTDRQYTNAFLLANSANGPPPPKLDPPSVLKGGDFRAYNQTRFAINTKNGQMSSAIPANPKTVVGNTPDGCNSLPVTAINWLALGNMLAPDKHPDSGKYGITPDRLHAFQLAEGRVGTGGQTVNMTLNACTSTNTC